MYLTKIFKAISLSGFISFFSPTNLKAQQPGFQHKDILTDFVFKGNHIRFDIAFLSTFKARLKQQTGNYPVSAAPAPGLSFSFKYQVNFNNCYSLITGPEATIAGRNMIVSFEKNDFSPPLIRDYNFRNKETYIENLILGIPVLLEKRKLYTKTKNFFVSGGVRLNISTGPDLESLSITLMHTDNTYYNAGGTDVIANNDAKPWISFPINAGHSWLLKNNNLLQLGICSNISFTKYIDGTYQINVPGRPVTAGRYSSTGSYIGFSFSYVFTNANYRIRKAYEKMKSRETKKPL